MTLQNLISDGSFETGNLSAWISSNATITSSHSHSGFYSVKLQGGATFSYVSQFVPINPGQGLEVLASLASLDIGLPISITIQVFYFDAGLNLLGNGLLVTIPGNQIPHIQNQTWMENYQTTIAAPLGSTQAFIVINTLPQVGTVDILIDDIAALIVTESIGPVGPTGATGATGIVSSTSDQRFNSFISGAPSVTDTLQVTVTVQANQAVKIDGFAYGTSNITSPATLRGASLIGNLRRNGTFVLQTLESFQNDVT